MGEIVKINGILHQMCKDDKYEIVRYALRCIEVMHKELTEGKEDLYLDVERRVLVIPKYMTVLPDEAVKWMLLHEAAHLTNGDDVTLKRAVEIIDYCNKTILDVLHQVLERNANIMTIDIYGGIHKDVLGSKHELKVEKKVAPIEMHKVFALLDEVHTIVQTQGLALQEELNSI